MQTTALEAMDREAETFQQRLKALRADASPSYIAIIERLGAIVHSNRAIIREALDIMGRRKTTTDHSR
jgi:hypothetical protein